MLFTELLLQRLEVLSLMNWVAPILIGLLYVTLSSLFQEPARQKFSAVMVAGAGAAYLSGGFGVWEFAFATVITFCAFHGLRDYRLIGAAWLLLVAVFLYVGFRANDPGLPLLLFLLVVGGAVFGLLLVVMRALLRQATALRTDLEAVI